MRNREWLNTLSDEEWIGKASDLIDRCVFCEIADIRNCHESDSECLKRQLAWLQVEHLTTADEDFEAIGFNRIIQTTTYASYGDKSGRTLVIEKNGENNYNINADFCEDEEYIKMWTDTLVDQIRTIADKKRKEVWG